MSVTPSRAIAPSPALILSMVYSQVGVLCTAWPQWVGGLFLAVYLPGSYSSKLSSGATELVRPNSGRCGTSEDLPGGIIPQLCLPRVDRLSSIDMLGVPYKSVNLGVDRAHQIGEPPKTAT
jgi:hypothetical protein